jgi:NAD(P)-dependent dehydrogenase (short-subunit alcohol dehydrogenase family)
MLRLLTRDSGMTKSAALDHANQGIRVNAICESLMIDSSTLADLIIISSARTDTNTWTYKRSQGSG